MKKHEDPAWMVWDADDEPDDFGWKPISSAPANIPIATKIDDADGCRNEQVMTLRNGFWWINAGESGEMYVYYTPTHWHPVRRA